MGLSHTDRHTDRHGSCYRRGIVIAVIMTMTTKILLVAMLKTVEVAISTASVMTVMTVMATADGGPDIMTHVLILAGLFAISGFSEGASRRFFGGF